MLLFGRLIVAPGLIGYGFGLVVHPQHAAHLADHRGDGTVVGALHRGKMLVGDADFIGKGPLSGGQRVVFILCALDGTADIADRAEDSSEYSWLIRDEILASHSGFGGS